MTYEEENEIDGLSFLEKKIPVSQKDITISFFTELHINEPAVFFDHLVNKKFITSDYHNTHLAKLYMITDAGKRYLAFLRHKKSKENIEYKLIGIQYWAGKYWYLFIPATALLTTLVTILVTRLLR